MQYFFILSGFIMTYVSQGKVDTFDWASGSVFVGRRLLRLIPGYYVAAAFSLIIPLVGEDIRPSSIRPYVGWPVNALLLQSVWPVRICPPLSGEYQETDFLSLTVNGPGWFTSVIVLLSIVFPFLYNRLPRHNMRGLMAALIFTILVRSLPTAMYYHLPRIMGLKYYSFVPTRLPEFVAGILSARICSLLPQHVMQMPMWGWIFDATLAFAFVLAYVMGEWEGVTDDGDYFLTGLFCLTMISARCAVVPPDGSKGSGTPASGLLGKFLAAPLLVRISEFTFGAYIIQFQVYRVFHMSWNPFTLAEGWWPLYIVCIWLAAVAMARGIEDPLRRATESWVREIQA
jgi:peptidoglycan/LPS O-acetylase OafA/YrhL